ncbi:hypothetical protein V6N13_067883 [Hibiscus sabdariffa]|uniref:Secreted protein n=1 Tax=Hibiscus sabdariffa TaxID=183260 RepID=A0ABR2DUU8_9ROSI
MVGHVVIYVVLNATVVLLGSSEREVAVWPFHWDLEQRICFIFKKWIECSLRYYWSLIKQFICHRARAQFYRLNFEKFVQVVVWLELTQALILSCNHHSSNLVLNFAAVLRATVYLARAYHQQTRSGHFLQIDGHRYTNGPWLH